MFITDSVGLPSGSKELSNRINFHNTYPYIVSTKLKSAPIIYCQGGGNSDFILNIINYVCYSGADLIILGFGVVDAVPRTFSKIQSSLLKLFNINIPKSIAKFKRKIFPTLFIPEKKFIRNINEIKNLLNNTNYIVLPILSSNSNLHEKINPGVKNNIERFNLHLKNCFQSNFLDASSKFFEEHFSEDQIHLNEIGHENLASLIIKKINE